LTPLGETQAQALRKIFPHQPDLIVVSPLRRTLQTALIGVARPEIPILLEPGWSASNSSAFPIHHGLKRAEQLTRSPDLQEADSWPCDTGSDVAVLESEFRDAKLDFSPLPPDWNSKEGLWAPTREALRARATRVRRKLRKRPERLILVITHGGLLRELIPEEMPYANTEWRMYAFHGGDWDEMAIMTRVGEGEEGAALGMGHETTEPEKAVEDHGV